MNDQPKNDITTVDTTEIDLLALLKLLLSKVWIIFISMVLCGVIAYTGSIFAIAPKYTATAMMYVNNNSISVGAGTFTFSSSQLSAAKSLLDVYVIILRSRTTLEEAIEEADLPYTYTQLREIVSAGSVSGTEIFSITATCTNPDDAVLIVNTLVDILPDRISDIVDGSSVRVVDEAIRPMARSSPSYTRYGLFGILLGAVASCGIIVIQDLLNTTVRDEEYLKQRYNIPILAVVPDVGDGTSRSYGYYRYKYGYHKYGYHKRAYERSYEQRYEEAKAEAEGKDGDNK